MSRTQIFALISAIALLIIVLELVRQRRLREEYSWLWLAAAVFYLLVAVWPNLIKWLANFIGTTNTVLVLIFLGLLFVILILIQYSVRLSRLTNQVKDLAQHMAILDCEQRDFNAMIGVSGSLKSKEEAKQILKQNAILMENIDRLKSDLNKLAGSVK